MPHLVHMLQVHPFEVAGELDIAKTHLVLF